MTEVNLAADDLRAAETPDALPNLLMYAALGAGAVILFLALRKKDGATA